MHGNYRDLLEEAKTDRHSGAWIVTRKAVSCLEALTHELSGGEMATLVSEVERVAAEILSAQPSMAQLVNLLNAIFVIIESETSTETLVLSRRISGEVKRFNETARNAVCKVAALGADLITDDKVVFIHSNSSTIMEVIKTAQQQGKIFHLLLSESRPIGEGRACAEELSRIGLQATYFVDAALSIAIDRADLILLGADSLSENTLINKVGTRAICLLGREAMVPCYAACESSKFIPGKLGPKKEKPRNPDEVWDAPPKEVTVENYYFDEVPLDLFDGVITEEGILTTAKLAGQIRARKLSARLLEMLK